MYLVDYLQCVANKDILNYWFRYYLYIHTYEDRMWYYYSIINNSSHSMCGINLPLMSGIILKCNQHTGLWINKLIPYEWSKIFYEWRTNILYGSSMPMDVCCGGDIDICEMWPSRRWEIFGWGQDSTYLLQRGVPFWLQLYEFELSLWCVRPYDTNMILTAILW